MARLRRATGLTQSEFGKLVGASRPWVSNLERGNLRGGRKIGTAAAGGSHFAYDSDYLTGGTAAVPLSFSMPLSQQRHPGETIRRWLSGLLPDNAELLRHWQQVSGAASTDPFDLLATPIGLDCAGAARRAVARAHR